ncbi:hypothetical protein IAQ61_008325 [Plenodomus lingam]|uniref:Uncharacterized protein n=1 Tax=Leptosphaeria maculans (strain JN3 / isolate v23.1.3 / race Av1-4-5-6-7-8) TaxID=985895 RepID=E4ZQC3_LEPMJ|nr:hypothetical protein LEMA_P032720.1 [Plenodomus lingam JN3]KAH9867730.1 hypothetical protein IAQ61_008325 [Plenodomus lingam]CBX93598.1 hypothetical protein LEMA_P032720.1 [Plenodomus lingam JN3]
MASVPVLTAVPTAYSGCCLALTRSLVHYFNSLLPRPPSLALSIGSGFGLLETYLVTEPYTVHLIGVEVAPSPNSYLPADNHYAVHGSRFLCPLAADATAWLFVYPRRAGLVREYLAEYGDASVNLILWAGPKADWDDYKSCFSGCWQVQVHNADEVGGSAWELIVVATKTRPLFPTSVEFSDVG